VEDWKSIGEQQRRCAALYPRPRALPPAPPTRRSAAARRPRSATTPRRRPDLEPHVVLGDEIVGGELKRGDHALEAIVTRLYEGGPQSVTQLTEGLGITRQATSKHLRAISRQWDAAIDRLRALVEE